MSEQEKGKQQGQTGAGKPEATKQESSKGAAASSAGKGGARSGGGRSRGTRAAQRTGGDTRGGLESRAMGCSRIDATQDPFQSDTWRPEADGFSSGRRIWPD
ncbi:MAG: hypothetical protein ACQERG_00790 [Pseudomonadota bacterium]